MLKEMRETLQKGTYLQVQKELEEIFPSPSDDPIRTEFLQLLNAAREHEYSGEAALARHGYIDLRDLSDDGIASLENGLRAESEDFGFFGAGSLAPGDDNDDSRDAAVVEGAVDAADSATSKTGSRLEDVTKSLKAGAKVLDVFGKAKDAAWLFDGITLKNRIDAEKERRDRAAKGLPPKGPAPQDDFDDNDTERGFGPHSKTKPDATDGDTDQDDKVEAEPPLSPAAQKLHDAFGPRDDDDTGPGALMRKRTEDLTADEVSALHGAAFDEKDTAARHAMQDRLRDFYRLTYGDGPARHDETGKMIQPTPQRAVPKKPSPAKDAHGRPVADGLQRVAATLARAAEKDGGQAVVKALQSGLSLMGRNLKSDGDPGPKTRAAVVDTVATSGPGKIDEARALGSFKSAARAAKTQPATAAGLRTSVKAAFAPLLTAPASPSSPRTRGSTAGPVDRRLRGGDTKRSGHGNDRDDDKSEAVSVTAVQQGLNDLKPKKKLAEDGVLGPKTADAFNTAVKDHGDDTVTQSVGRAFGFLS